MSFGALEVATFTPSPISMSSKTRVNEHLAVLMPKSLWKPDSSSTYCDNFFCRVSFSIFERRHHCRKCGGIFCATCTGRTTQLLDTSMLDFVHPPRNASIHDFNSPISESRVCDDCYDQIHGCPSTPPTPELDYCSPSRSPSPPPPSLMSNSSYSSSSTTRSSVQVHLDAEPSYGALDAYPLKRSSVLCKATGGGRWEPKPHIVAIGRIDDLVLRKEEKERRRRANPVICDGGIQYRFPREPEPEDAPRNICLSTF
ncbi:FYVE-domain-containing protein [Hymenopellis radicata]|nr:FYVE-domain-containing protein [Hymenopellis radicata]